MTLESAPWEDTPDCPNCGGEGFVLPWVPAEDNHPPSEAPEDWPIGEDGEELNSGAALDLALAGPGLQRHCWCARCGNIVDVGKDGRARALAAQAWWDREDREEAWVDLQRRRKIDRIAAEHAARQTLLFEGGE